MDKIDKRSVIIGLSIIMAFGLLSAITTFHKLESALEDNRAENFALNEANKDLRDENDMLIAALEKEHLIAIKDNSKLLVANLAWIDLECGTHYLPAICDVFDENKVNLADVKDMLDKDENARIRVVKVIANYLDRTEIFALTEDYYEYLASGGYLRFEDPELPSDTEINDRSFDLGCNPS